MHKVKPRTAQTVGSRMRRGNIKEVKSHTYVENPAKTRASNDASVAKGLYPECQSKTAPCAYTISSSFPKKDGDGTASNTCYSCRKYEHSAKSLTWWIDGRENAEFQDENCTYESQSIISG